ncbi:putative bifunctional diguanylate cyclase/phosphodiesterase [Rhabdochromatium marinum]|uniref:putative bifunctional diguanylate cyclase/phosphodiesterase n=1 Tax=Rhabdochromatium marinum TaxID=48729 RepID=UPI0019033BA9|nr:bifunctional diguanylate cyclase/phosphodiesterase [Rhabdochromatium marinum]MBK1647817.1 hypothetical protein [Rhabdochromatium marinum]
MTDDQALLDLALELMATGAMIEAAADRIIRVTPGFEHLTGLTASQLQEKTLTEWLTQSNDSACLQALEDSLAANGAWRGSLQLPTATGQPLRCTLELRETLSTGVRYRLARLDLPDSQAAADTASSHLDPLTQLPSQTLLFDRLEQALIAAQRVQRGVAVLTLGVDQLSRINDGLGYAAGDQAIQAIAKRLLDSIRRSDSLGRLGSDRFALTMQIAAQEDAVKIAEKLLKALTGVIDVAGQQLSLSVSIGISLFPNDGDDRDYLLKASASAMQHAKQAGGNNYQFFCSQMNTRAEQRIRLESDLRIALAQKQFAVYYQPKVNIETNQIVGAEALIRWNHPTQGMVSPADFIPVAEDSGLIGPIGDWVLRRVCIDNARWQAEGLAIVRVSVNMAAPQFRASDLVENIETILRETGLPAEFLEIEITESLMVSNPDRVAADLWRMRDLGLHIAIDDFGTGYSSLSYLAKFPITTLKIDRAFIRDIEHAQSTAEITRSIIALSRGLELDIVAEGTETAEHIEFLRRHGCTTAQGYYYSRPVTAEEFAHLLRQGHMPLKP